MIPHLSTLRAACFHAARDPSRIADARLYLAESASLLGLSLPKSSPARAPSTIQRARAALIDAAFNATTLPNVATFATLRSALHALDASGLHASAKLPARSMSQQAKSEPRYSRIPDHVPPVAMRWQTSPPIGTNPLHVAALAQHVQRIEQAKRERERKHAQSIRDHAKQSKRRGLT